MSSSYLCMEPVLGCTALHTYTLTVYLLKCLCLSTPLPEVPLLCQMGFAAWGQSNLEVYGFCVSRKSPQSVKDRDFPILQAHSGQFFLFLLLFYFILSCIVLFVLNTFVEDHLIMYMWGYPMAGNSVACSPTTLTLTQGNSQIHFFLYFAVI